MFAVHPFRQPDSARAGPVRTLPLRRQMPVHRAGDDGVSLRQKGCAVCVKRRRGSAGCGPDIGVEGHTGHQNPVPTGCGRQPEFQWPSGQTGIARFSPSLEPFQPTTVPGDSAARRRCLPTSQPLVGSIVTSRMVRPLPQTSP